MLGDLAERKWVLPQATNNCSFHRKLLSADFSIHNIDDCLVQHRLNNNRIAFFFRGVVQLPFFIMTSPFSMMTFNFIKQQQQATATTKTENSFVPPKLFSYSNMFHLLESNIAFKES